MQGCQSASELFFFLTNRNKFAQGTSLPQVNNLLGSVTEVELGCRGEVVVCYGTRGLTGLL